MKLIAGAAIGAVALAGITGLVVTLAQPSPIQRAGDTCSGAKPFYALLDEIKASESPAPEEEGATDEDEAADDGVMTALFEGVVSVEDDGSTLIVNTKPDDEDALGVTSLSLDCVYEQLDVPKHITERIGVTRSLDGRQDGKWGGFTASWSYHPDNGANLIVVQE